MFPLAIPLRRKVMHAASVRGVADAVVVAVELTTGTVGYGETLPRPYVTGETVDSVIEAVHNVFAPFLMDFHPVSFPEALEAIESLPWHNVEDRLIPAARAAVELAMLDATMRRFGRDSDAMVQWMGLPGFGSPGSLRQTRFSGVLTAEDLATTLRQLRLMYWGGLRHFKLRVGISGDRDRLERVAAYLKRPITKGRVTLRVDANGQWSKDEAIEWLANTAHLPIASVEQPLARGKEDDLPILNDLFEVPLMHDESLVTIEDGQRLIGLGVADGFNIRISKCGGLIPALRLAALARRADVRIQLGCMIGETSILSAAGLRFLQVCPAVVWAEGCFGSFLLESDVVAKGLRFGYGGRPPRPKDSGLGVEVDTQCLRVLCEDQPIVLNL
ncbi:MAG: enolase C-terminal domain-like protein [Phycisphaerae bacterium]